MLNYQWASETLFVHVYLLVFYFFVLGHNYIFFLGQVIFLVFSKHYLNKNKTVSDLQRKASSVH